MDQRNRYKIRGNFNKEKRTSRKGIIQKKQEKRMDSNKFKKSQMK